MSTEPEQFHEKDGDFYVRLTMVLRIADQRGSAGVVSAAESFRRELLGGEP